MSAKKSQRITVSGRNLQFLKQLSGDMDEQSLTEVLSYLLTDVRLLNYQIGNKPAPLPQRTPIGYSFDPATFENAAFIAECDRNQNNYTEQDPIIARFASLIEEF